MKFCKECGLKLGMFNRSGYCDRDKPETTVITVTPNADAPAWVKPTTITITPKGNNS